VLFTAVEDHGIRAVNLAHQVEFFETNAKRSGAMLQVFLHGEGIIASDARGNVQRVKRKLADSTEAREEGVFESCVMEERRGVKRRDSGIWKRGKALGCLLFVGSEYGNHSHS
jgi:hypothetical protein